VRQSKTKMHHLVLVITIIFLFSVCPVSAAATPRILILPFTIYAEQDLGFLQKGIEMMLATRMTYEGKAEVVNTAGAQASLKDIPATIDKEKALALAAEWNTRYVVSGSITVFGESISIAANFFDAAQNEVLVSFNKFGKDHGDVISHVALLTDVVHQKIFGTWPKGYQAIKTAQPDPDVAKRETDLHKHPDTLIKSIRQTSPTTLPDGLIQSSAPAQLSIKDTSWKSRKFNGSINRMAIGDINGDNTNNLVFVDGTAINIFSLTNNRLSKINTITGQGKLLTVDIADINNNGISEIFVTAFTSNSHRVSSFVLEWDGTRFKKIVKNARYFFRVTEHPTLGKVLLGQKQSGKKGKSVFAEDIYTMVWHNGAYSPENQYDLPKKMNLYEFTHGNIANTGEEILLSLTAGGNLRLQDKTGREIWISKDVYGGSNNFISLPAEHDQAKDTEHIYLPLRIYLADVDNDGQKEIISIKNKSLAPRFFSGIRIYKNGHIQCLSLSNAGLQPKWQTRQATGYISDLVIADLDNDGNSELVYAVVSKPSLTLAGSAKSYIVSQELPQ
jgi:TolB-like protein